MGGQESCRSPEQRIISPSESSPLCLFRWQGHWAHSQILGHALHHLHPFCIIKAASLQGLGQARQRTGVILIGTLREKEPQLLLKVPKDTTDS